LSAALFTGAKLSNRKNYTSSAFELLSQDAKSFQKGERINSHSNSSKPAFRVKLEWSMRELESSGCYHAISHSLFVDLILQMRGHQCLGIGIIGEIQFRLARSLKWERWASAIPHFPDSEMPPYLAEFSKVRDILILSLMNTSDFDQVI